MVQREREGTTGSARSSRSAARSASATSRQSHKTVNRDQFRNPPSTLSEYDIRNKVPSPAQPGGRVEKPSADRSVAATPTPLTPRVGVTNSRVSFGQTPRRRDVGTPRRFSGTTILATDSEHEEPELDPESMIDALPDLATKSKQILGDMVSRNFSFTRMQKALGIPRFKQVLRDRSRKFAVAMEHFRRTERFISINSANKALPLTASLHWKPELIWRKANLAQLALDVITTSLDTVNFSALQQLDQHFPSPFVGVSLSAEDRDTTSSLRRETFLLGLEIRTQYCLLFLREENRMQRDAADVLAEVFNAVSIQLDRLRGWEADGLQDDLQHLPTEFEETVSERMDSIRETFYSDGPRVQELNDKFPWSTFVENIAEWMKNQTDGIDELLQGQEPLDAIVPRLGQELQRRSSFGQQSVESEEDQSPAEEANQREHSVSQNTESQLQPEPLENNATYPSRPRSFSNRACISHLEEKYKSARTALATSSPQMSGTHHRTTAPNEAHFSQERTAETSRSRGEETERGNSPKLSKPMADLHAKLKGLPPRNAFINRQTGARRVSPINFTQDMDSGGEPSTRVNTRKRGASHIEDSESSASTGFQRDRREVDAERNRARVAKRMRVEREEVQESTNENGLDHAVSVQIQAPRRTTTRATTSSSSVQRSQRLPRNGGPRLATGKEPLVTPDDVYAENLERPRRLRRRWTEEEDERLLRLMEKYDTQWSKIGNVDSSQEKPLLVSRGQFALKDRARQLLFSYLRDGTAVRDLPKNLEYANLNGRMKEQLQALGTELPKSSAIE